MTPTIEPVKDYLVALQKKISQNILERDGNITQVEDNWERPLGGGGKTLAFANGNLIEKAGVNFSHVSGQELPPSASVIRPQLKNCLFQAVGLSVIIHPLNPYIPTCHANFRLFLAESENEITWWFGGGFDLTPYYGFDEDCHHWHKTAKEACDPFGIDVYPKFKKWADDYFLLKHRNEQRGIGGIFFDDLNQWDFETCFAFIQNAGDHFVDAYFPIVDLRRKTPYGEKERQFQCYRRGRYVEFNLLYDRGTLFGLQSGGRIESILISLPPLVSWQYNWQPPPGSEESKLYEIYLKPHDWANVQVATTA